MTINNNNGATCMARPAASLPGGARGLHAHLSHNISIIKRITPNTTINSIRSYPCGYIFNKSISYLMSANTSSSAVIAEVLVLSIAIN